MTKSGSKTPSERPLVSVLQREEDAELEQLPMLSEDEFLPSVNPWMVLGGIGILCGLALSLLLSSVLVYKVTVKASGSIRPTGDLRLVESELDGTVTHIEGVGNQIVRAGDIIARLDVSRLETARSQLQEDIRQKESQLHQISAELESLDSRLAAEANLIARSIEAAEASLTLQRRRYRDQQIITEANLEEALSELRLAEAELARYTALEGTGIVSLHQIDEKVAVVRLAEANLRRAQAQTSPINAEIAIAEQEIAQQRASGAATLAALRQQREQVVLRRIEMENKLQTSRKDLDQIEIDLERSIVRSPIHGTLLQLRLRNPGQVLHSGEAIAYVAPVDMPLEFKVLVASQDIGKVEIGQSVTVRVAACPYTDYGVLVGTVSSIAPDTAPQQGELSPIPGSAGSFYDVTILPDAEHVGTNNQTCRLQPGMEGKADIITHEETILTFLLRKARLISNI